MSGDGGLVGVRVLDMALLAQATDYTSKDFDSPRLRLLNLVRLAYPEWTDLFFQELWEAPHRALRVRRRCPHVLSGISRSVRAVSPRPRGARTSSR